MRYRLNSPDVIQETVDGEALVIHTPSGTYFSLEGTAEYVWNALLDGHTPDDIAAAYADTGRDDPASVTVAVEHFARQLQDEQLLVPCDQRAATGVLEPAPHPFAAPALQKFTDLQELLLVDPIHEVDPHAGWPQRREPS